MWEENDPEVEEIASEQGKRYVRRMWCGWTDSLGRWNPNMHCPSHEQDRINQLVMTRKLEKAEQAQRQAEEAQQAEPAGAPEALGEAEDGEPSRLGRSPWTHTGLPYQAAGAFGGVLGAGAGAVTAGLGLALSPLGASGAGVTQVGGAIMNLLVSAVNSLTMLGASVLTIAIGAVFAGAIAACAGVVLVAVGGMFGRVAETITEAMSGVVRIVRDLFDTAIQYAQSAMQLVYFGGQTPGAAVGLMSAMQGFGVSPETTAGIFGQWQMRPEFLGPRLGAMGVPMGVGPEGETDWPGTLEAMRTQVRGLPELMRYPMLAATLGPQAAQQFLPMMEMPERRFQEALRQGEELRPLTEELQAIREELVPLRGQFDLLTTTIKVDLIGAVLAPISAVLETLLDMFGGHREAIQAWLQDTATRALRGLLLGVEYIVRHIPQAVDWLEKVWNKLKDIWERLAPVAERGAQAAGFAEEHPVATAAGLLAVLGIGQVATGGLRAVGARLLGLGGAEAAAPVLPLLPVAAAAYGAYDWYKGLGAGERLQQQLEAKAPWGEILPTALQTVPGLGWIGRILEGGQTRAEAEAAAAEAPAAEEETALQRTILDTLREIRESLSPERMKQREDERKAEEEQGDTHHYIHLLPSPEFLVKFEEYLVQRTWRNIQLAVG